MPYTLWSKGRLLGHTDFGYIASNDEHKMGWFHPTEVGEKILQIITEPSRVSCAYRRGDDLQQITTDLNAAFDRVAALELEVRSPEGELLPTKDIGITDTERLLALAAEGEDEELPDYLEDPARLAEIEAAVAHDLELLDFDDEEPEDYVEKEWPRYQIQAYF